MNIIYYGTSKYELIKKILNNYEIDIDNLEYKKFNIIDRSDLLILNFKNYKKINKNYVDNKLKDCLEGNFNMYKKYIFMLNLNKSSGNVQSFIKNKYSKLSLKNKIIITAEGLRNINSSIINSFHKIRIDENNEVLEYEPLVMLVNEMYDIYDDDKEPLTMDKILCIKNIAYNICKYSIPIKLFIYELMNKFIDNPRYTMKIKSEIIKFMAKVEWDIVNNYRILIHVENMLIGIYNILITSYL